MNKKEKISFVKIFSKSAIWDVSIAFERVEMMKNRSQLMFCVKVSQAAIQKHIKSIDDKTHSNIA
jgi:hypothetical protein